MQVLPALWYVISNVDNISREQFESLQKDVASLQRELNYWQNTTISILKKYLLENEGSYIHKLYNI
jgi:hypothetical protein